MIYRFGQLYKAANLLIDLSVLNVAMIIAYLINDKSHTNWFDNKQYLLIVIFNNCLWLIAASYTKLYRDELFKESTRLIRSVLRSYIVWLSLMFIIVIEMLRPASFKISLEFLIYSAGSFLVFLFVNKFLYLLLRQQNGLSSILAFKVVIAGAGSAGQDLFHYMKSEKYCGYEPVGFFDDIKENVPAEADYLGTIDDCILFAAKNGIGDVFCALPSRYGEKIRKLMKEADDAFVRFKLVPDYQNFQQRAVNLQSLGHIPLLSIRKDPLENLSAQLIKRIFDIIVSLTIMITFSWLYILLAILIKLGSRGPVLYKGERLGLNNKLFKCYKFRSMLVGADREHFQTVKGDHRITKLGAYLRRTSLDELPQFFNVLRGDMSIVGPRPHPVKLTQEYNRVDKYMIRHFLKPGITGWPQVIGLRGIIVDMDDLQQRIQADAWYMENWSILLDLKILFLTVRVIFGDRRAF